VARPEGLEPPTLCFEGRCSIQLSYRRCLDSRRFRAFAATHLFFASKLPELIGLPQTDGFLAEVLDLSESVTIPPDTDSAQLLRIAAASLEELKFPPLVRPNVPFNSTPTKDLVDWAIQLYSFSSLSQFRALLRGVIPLMEARNIPALRLIVRALFELGAHSCYVKKHVKQHLEAKNLEAAWNFLIPVGTSSLYTISPYPPESQLFPSPAHIEKVIDCFNEIMEGEAADIYSLLSEFCHPDMAALRQHYQWDGSQLVTFDAPEGNLSTALPLGASVTLAALDAVSELLELSNETEIRTQVIQLLQKLVSSR
jgi:hypothetical protein